MLKNRLEQFKKRQRDDAVKATETASRLKQEEAAAAAAAEAEGGEVPDEQEIDEDDWVEEYEPEMSPEPVEVNRMAMDDRRCRIVDELEHLRAIVSHPCPAAVAVGG